MCGIAGIVGNSATSERVAKMALAMNRRGPDDSGLWSDNNNHLSFGHARLSIIDLSSAGHQPMCLINSSNDINESILSIVFNGEIYNYKELRIELEAKGAHFRTNTDTEVILWGWKFWDRDTPRRLRGMFAFVIWDSEKRLLSLVRDRMGIKPLLWYCENNDLIFASTIKAILASGVIPRIVDHLSLFDYLLQGAVLQPRSIIRNVHSLDPGTIRTYSLSEENKLLLKDNYTYWTLNRNNELAGELKGMTYNEQVHLLRFKLEEACRYHLVADVQVGSFLSGGVDSTVITALMNRFSPSPIKSFSIGFPEDTGLKNELLEAKTAAKYIGCDHTEIILTGKEIADSINDFLEVLDQPSVDGLNTYWVSKLTHNEGMKVALSGLGADELFAGYDSYGWFRDSERNKASFLDKFITKIHRFYPSHLTNESARKVMPFNEMIYSSRRQMTENKMTKIINPEILRYFKSDHFLHYINELCLVNQEMFNRYTEYECRNYLVNTLLRDADAVSMGNSLEVRPIYLDYKLVEYAYALPESSKWKDDKPKSILKDATQDLLPPDFFNREKTGFTLPTSYWIENELSEHFKDILTSKAAAILLTSRFLNQLSRGATSNNKWLLFILFSWIHKEKVEFDI